MGLDMKTKQALANETAKRYRNAKRTTKTKILDEFVGNTGYCRKYALHILANWDKVHFIKIDGDVIQVKVKKSKKRQKRIGKTFYTEKDLESLKRIWQFFWNPCGKLLAPLLAAQMPFLVSFPDFEISDTVRAHLDRISASTIDRKLRDEKKKLLMHGLCGTKHGPLLRSQIPVRTHFPFDERKPGFFEADTVHNCGESTKGEYNLSLTATCVYSGWIEIRALLNKAHKWTLEGFTDMFEDIPFPMLGLDTDNGSEFINKDMIAWCTQRTVQFTRSRPYKHNDNCHIEQKNNKCVRDYVGYYRFTTQQECDALTAVYRVLCPLLNYFMPTVKLVNKTRIGAKVRKVYDTPTSPYQRLMAYPDLPRDVRQELTSRYQSYNPVLLQQEVTNCIAALISVHTQQISGTVSASSTVINLSQS
ncbi:MAG: DDE-type integrase/transposase/recombinase [Termitinemataceae bacterium]|nr:MAG: DDE-type integrase/transposase/recombinase [Termitinemataceae bacterium]